MADSSATAETRTFTCDSCGEQFSAGSGGICSRCGRTLCGRHLHGIWGIFRGLIALKRTNGPECRTCARERTPPGLLIAILTFASCGGGAEQHDAAQDEAPVASTEVRRDTVAHARLNADTGTVELPGVMSVHFDQVVPSAERQATIVISRDSSALERFAVMIPSLLYEPWPWIAQLLVDEPCPSAPPLVTVDLPSRLVPGADSVIVSAYVLTYTSNEWEVHDTYEPVATDTTWAEHGRHRFAIPLEAFDRPDQPPGKCGAYFSIGLVHNFDRR